MFFSFIYLYSFIYLRLGSGTGIFTRNLLAHPAWANSIGHLNAVEPSEGMRKTFDKNIQDKRIVTTNGTFDVTGVEDSWADVIIIAQVSIRVCSNITDLTTFYSRHSTGVWTLTVP